MRDKIAAAIAEQQACGMCADPMTAPCPACAEEADAALAVVAPAVIALTERLEAVERLTTGFDPLDCGMFYIHEEHLWAVVIKDTEVALIRRCSGWPLDPQRDLS